MAWLPIRLDRGELEAQRASHLGRAESLAREIKGFKSRRYIELLILAKRTGVHLGYISNPNPHGPGIEFLMKAATILGEDISPSTAKRLIVLHGKMQPAEAAPMHAAGKMDAGTFVVDAAGNVKS